MESTERTPPSPRAERPEAPAFESGTLWPRVVRRTRSALERGALTPVETRSEVVPEGGIPFSVRVVSSLKKKQAADAPRDERAGDDPFLHPDPDLLVAGVTDDYLAVLNLFPVIRHHLLLVTRGERIQARPLGGADFDAVATCLAEIDGLAFYNSGPEAGASQRHRHLQLVPFPIAELGESAPPTPIDPVLAAVLDDPARATLPAYDFVHAVAPLPETAWNVEDRDERIGRAAHAMALAYRALAARTGLGPAPDGEERPYNLLITRRWMLLVPRSRGEAEGIDVNALGFAGALLVKDGGGLETVRRLGPLGVLRRVAVGSKG